MKTPPVMPRWYPALVFCIFTAMIAVSAMAAYWAGYDDGAREHVNDLISAGFTLTDPAGFEVGVYGR